MSQVQEPVLSAAAAILKKHGVAGLTMRRLGKATGLSRASLYRQCGGLEVLFEALKVADREDSRTKILMAARDAFGRVGFDAASIDEIAGAAKVGTATVYRHFKDKEGLITAFIENLSAKKAARNLKPSGDLRADLEQLARTVLGGMRDDAPIVRLFLIESLRGSRILPRVRALAPTHVGAAVAALLRTAVGVRTDIDAHILAQTFGGMVLAFGVIAPVLRGEPSADPRKTAHAIVSIFLDGALGRKS